MKSDFFQKSGALGMYRTYELCTEWLKQTRCVVKVTYFNDGKQKIYNYFYRVLTRYRSVATFFFSIENE